MLKYHFEIIRSAPVKGRKITGSKDYDTQVTIEKDGKIIFDEMIVVRKNKEGVFPEMDPIRNKIAAASIRKELVEKLKEYFKKIK